MIKRVFNTLTIITWTAIFLTLLLSLVVPQHLYFSYPSFTAKYNCETDRIQYHAKRWLLMDVRAEGVDQTFEVGSPIPVDRLEWQGSYKQGHQQSNWTEPNHLKAGSYYTVATTLELKVFGILPVLVDGPITPVFNITESCES